MSNRSDKMYKNSPELARDEESGKMTPSKSKSPNEAEKKSARTNDGTEGMQIHEEGMPAHVRHAHERRDMHSRHETEHAMHDTAHAGKGKEDMHKRHEDEHKAMNKRHDKEMTKGSKGSGGGEEKIKKVEKGA